MTASDTKRVTGTMTRSQFALYACASDLAFYAMGKITRRRGCKSETVWAADEDPLAWWCFVEAMIALPKKARALQRMGKI